MAEPNPSNVAPWYLRNINQALALDETSGNVYVRTGFTGNIVIEGNVNIPGNIDAHISEVGNSGNLTVPWMPVSIDGNSNVTIAGGNVGVSGNVNIGTMPNVNAAVTGTVAVSSITGNIAGITSNINIGTMPNVNANITGGNVNAAVTGTVAVSSITGNIAGITANVTVVDGGGSLTVDGNVGITGNVNIGTMPEVEIKNDTGNPISVSKDSNVNSVTNPLYVEGVNNASFFAPTQSDSFGRLRVSNPQTLFDTQTRYYNHNQFASNTAGAGTYTFDSNSSTFAMAVNTASGDKVYAETYKVFPYQPGKSLLIYSSFCMNIAKPNLRQRVGYFNSQNGIYFEQSDSTLYMVIRSYSSGSVVENRVAQSSWNGDPLNGLGPSGVELNTAVDQIFFCDIEWLGVGSVRTGFIIGGQYIVVHTFNHANIPGNTTTYMSTGSLPLRFEIENTGTASSSSTLRQICSTVISEGGYSLSGTPRSIGHNLGTPIQLPNDTSFKPLLSIRLLSTCPDSIVLPTFFTIAPVAQSTFKYRIYSRAVTTGGTWTGIGASSPVEYNLAPTAVSSGEIVTEGFIMSSNQTAAAPSQESFGFEVQLQRQPFTNVMYEYVMTAATIGTNQDVYASIEWQEVN
jgi:hypothetical protein